MEIFGIGPLEIVLIALVAFVVLGPDRIPGVMRQLGTWARQLRETANNITRNYNTEIREITGEITALQEEIRSIQRDLGGIATGFMTMPPLDTPPARSDTAAPANPIGPERSAAIVQSLTDDIKRASAPLPAPPNPADTPAAPAGIQSQPDNSFEI
jgi:sec-independent protein translocase protein TatB